MVVNVGTPYDPVLNFTIPRGAPGPYAPSYGYYLVHNGTLQNRDYLLMRTISTGGSDIVLQADANTISLREGFLYLISFNVSSIVPDSLLLIPVVNGTLDFYNNSRAYAPTPSNQVINVLLTYLFPVTVPVEIKFQAGLPSGTSARNADGIVSVVQLGLLS